MSRLIACDYSYSPSATLNLAVTQVEAEVVIRAHFMIRVYSCIVIYYFKSSITAETLIVQYGRG